MSRPVLPGGFPRSPHPDAGAEREIHDLDPEEFLEEVYSFDFWFEAVEGYLAGTVHGHRPDTAEVALSGEERERLVTVLCNYALGETAALEGASGLVAVAPTRLSKVFLSTQVVDEGRHLEVFLRRLKDLGVPDPEAEVERRASPSLRLFRRRLLDLVAGRDWESALFAQNVILESLEFAVFHRHAQNADPVTREVLQGVVKDERRHIGFGENELGRRLAETPRLRARIAQVKSELDPLVLNAIAESVHHLGLARAEEEGLGRIYLESVDRLGFAE